MSTNSTSPAADLYLRLSDARTEGALDGREEKLRARAAQLGWTVACVAIENDIDAEGRPLPASASRRRSLLLAARSSAVLSARSTGTRRSLARRHARTRAPAGRRDRLRRRRRGLLADQAAAPPGKYHLIRRQASRLSLWRAATGQTALAGSLVACYSGGTGKTEVLI
jgi:hypothetical protein